MVSCFQGEMILLIVKQSTLGGPKNTHQPTIMQWLIWSLVLAIRASCCDTSPVASDLSCALGAVLNTEHTTMGEKNNFYLHMHKKFHLSFQVIREHDRLPQPPTKDSRANKAICHQ